MKDVSTMSSEDLQESILDLIKEEVDDPHVATAFSKAVNAMGKNRRELINVYDTLKRG
jgi:hypothetical protein